MDISLIVSVTDGDEMLNSVSCSVGADDPELLGELLRNTLYYQLDGIINRAMAPILAKKEKSDGGVQPAGPGADQAKPADQPAMAALPPAAPEANAGPKG